MILVLTSRRLFPDLHTLPDLTTPRPKLDKNSPEAKGVTPFVLQRLEDIENRPSGIDSEPTAPSQATAIETADEKQNAMEDWKKECDDGRRTIPGRHDIVSVTDTASVQSFASLESTDSATPLRPHNVEA